MQIVLAENFQNDTVDSILTRYPGTTKSAAYTVPSEWVVDATSVLNCEKIPTSGFTRVEFYVTFTGTPGASNAVQNFFGVTLATPTANQLAINGNTLTAPAAFSTSTYLHLVFEQQEDDSWMGYAYSDNGLKEVFVAGLVNWTTRWVGAAQGYLPNRVTSVLIVHDTEPGTRLSSVTWENAVLTVDNQGTWQFSQDGFVEDTDKSDPTVTDPKIYTSTDEGVITFDTNAYDAVVWHVAGRTDNMDQSILDLNDGADSYRLIGGVKTRSIIAPTLELKVREPATRVIAQPDFSRLNSVGPAVIDDYSDLEWGQLSSRYSLASGRPCIWFGSDSSSPLITLLPLPTGFGLSPFTIDLEFQVSSGTTGLDAAATAYIAVGGSTIVDIRKNQTGSNYNIVLPTGTVPSTRGPTFHSLSVVFIPTTGRTGYFYSYLNGTRVGTTATKTLTTDGLTARCLAYSTAWVNCFLGAIRITEGVLYPEQESIPPPAFPYPNP